MKKVILGVVVVLVLYGLWYLATNTARTPVEKTPTTATSITDTSKPDPKNATFSFEDGPITLKNGSDVSSIAPGSAVTKETTLSDIIGYGDINNDGKNDSVAILVQDSGGSGVFIYIVGYISGPVAYTGTNAIFVGDRVQPKSISIKNGIITLSYLDRGPDEAIASDPTISTSKQYAYVGGELVEK